MIAEFNNNDFGIVYPPETDFSTTDDNCKESFDLKHATKNLSSDKLFSIENSLSEKNETRECLKSVYTQIGVNQLYLPPIKDLSYLDYLMSYNNSPLRQPDDFHRNQVVTSSMNRAKYFIFGVLHKKSEFNHNKSCFFPVKTIIDAPRVINNNKLIVIKPMRIGGIKSFVNSHVQTIIIDIIYLIKRHTKLLNKKFV